MLKTHVKNRWDVQILTRCSRRTIVRATTMANSDKKKFLFTDIMYLACKNNILQLEFH